MGFLEKNRDWLVIFGTILIFSIAKLSSLSFRFGDENVYFYMSGAILQGLVPHLDFFLADPVVFIYIMAGFKMLFGSHLILFKLLPILFDSLSAILIYLLLRKDYTLAWLGPIFYLASFTVISTSDYVTGAEVMIFFLLIALLLDQKDKPIWSGVFWALACLCKLYAGPALIGFIIYKLFNKSFTEVRWVVLGGLATTVLIMAPFFIMAPQETWYNLITHQFNRPEGINKWNIFSFFLKFEWLLILASIWGAIKIKSKLPVFALVSSAIFFLFYRDLYFLYLHILLPFIVILTVSGLESLWLKQKEIAYAFLITMFAMFLYGSSEYVNIYQPQGVFENPKEIAEALANTPEDFPIYGVQEVAPLVALYANKKIFNNVIDTNTQNFASGTHDLEKISKEAVENGIYLVARTAEYPSENIKDTGFEGYFKKELWAKYCTTYKSFSRPTSGDAMNQIKIYKCKS